MTGSARGILTALLCVLVICAVGISICLFCSRAADDATAQLGGDYSADVGTVYPSCPITETVTRTEVIPDGEVCAHCGGEGVLHRSCEVCTQLSSGQVSGFWVACGSCSGGGSVTCPSCGGLRTVLHGYHSHDLYFPGWGKCKKCGLLGWDWDDCPADPKYQTCSTCAGKGTVECSACAVSGRVGYVWSSCPRCGGDQVYEEQCAICGGDGRSDRVVTTQTTVTCTKCGGTGCIGGAE